MQKLLILLLALPVTTNICEGQDRFLTRGSAEQTRQLFDMQERWRSSKKITLLDTIPDSLPRQGDSIPLNALRDGLVGRLDYWQYEVLQIVGPNDLILFVNNPRIPAIWLTDYSTKDLVDGDQVRLVGPIEVSGTKSYETIDGIQKTVRVVKLVRPERLAEIEAEIKRKADDLLMRTWTDKSGKHSFVGKFKDFKNNRVFLERKDDHKTIDVGMPELSTDDQKWIRDELKRRRESNKPKTSKRKS